MKHTLLGRSDLRVSAVCLGTMTFGQQNTEAEAHAQLDHAFARGVNFIDTAEMYPVPPRAGTCHRTEEIVGTWLARQPRDRVILATKVAGPGRDMTWIRGGPPALDRRNIRAALEGSLRRLKTDYIDLYQLHWPERNVPLFGASGSFDPDKERLGTPIVEQLQVLDELVKEGRIRHFGLSNEQPWGVCEFVRLAAECDFPRPVAVQNAYGLVNRVFEYGLSEVCFREEIGLLAYSPLAMGHLTGKYLDDPNAPGRLSLFPGFGRRYEKPNLRPAVAAYAALARAHGLTPAQLALAFVGSRWFVASTVIGATSLAQLEENIGALEVGLGQDVLEAIETIHLRCPNPAP